MRQIDGDAALEEIDRVRKELLAQGMVGAEHILVHYGRRIIEELPTIEFVPSVITVTETPMVEYAPVKKSKEEWLERLILDNELLGEWFCDEMATSEWCEENCRFMFPHRGRECLEKAFELGFFNCGARMERSEDGTDCTK